MFLNDDGDDGDNYHHRHPEMEKAIKIAQIQKRPKNISTNKFATKQRKWPLKLWKSLQIAWTSIIYADSTGADSSGADNTVSKALSMHNFPRSVPKN